MGNALSCKHRKCSMTFWLLKSKDMWFLSSRKEDKEYMIHKKKVLTQRNEYVEIIKPFNNNNKNKNI